VRKRIATFMGALTVSLGLASMLASPAAASESNNAVDTSWSFEFTKECHYLTYVSGCVQPNGDVLWVKDNVPNDYSVSLTWKDLDSNRSGTCLNTLGSDRGWGTCNKNFTEGHRIEWALGWRTSGGWNFSQWYETRV
jgi:hypothetical protein